MDKITRTFAWLRRWQEPAIWLPLLVGLALGGWILLGALDRTAGADALALLVLLPVVSAYVLLAGGAVYLIRRRWRFRMTDVQQQEWMRRLMDDPRGPLTVYAVDAAVTVLSLLAVLGFVVAFVQ